MIIIDNTQFHFRMDLDVDKTGAYGWLIEVYKVGHPSVTDTILTKGIPNVNWYRQVFLRHRWGKAQFDFISESGKMIVL